jgi:hypothetical protein
MRQIRRPCRIAWLTAAAAGLVAIACLVIVAVLIPLSAWLMRLMYIVWPALIAPVVAPLA